MLLRKTSILITALFCACHLQADPFGVTCTSEIQTDFKNNYNFANLLKLSANIPVKKRFAFELGTISIVKTRQEGLLDVLQTPSNIEEENLPFALCVMDFNWRINEHNSLFMGIRNMNEDYFNSEVTSFFTNSSCGIYPTLSCNYTIANFPYASVGIHYAHERENFTIQASLYNGRGYNRFTGRENIFRFCPKGDGLFALTQGEYRWRGSHYFIGGAFHYGTMGEERKRFRSTLWLYLEQQVTDHFCLTGGYSHAFRKENPCKEFVGVGGKYSWKRTEIGFFSDYAKFNDAEECANEVTCKIQIREFLYLQPALHLLLQKGKQDVMGFIRLGIEL